MNAFEPIRVDTSVSGEGPAYRPTTIHAALRRVIQQMSGLMRLPVVAAGTAGLALSPLAPAVLAQGYNTLPAQLPQMTIDADKEEESGYRAEESSNPKLTEPLRDTPQSISTVTRELLDDRAATTMRDALRNVPGVSIAAGEGGNQGDSLTIRGFSARSDIYLDNMRDFGSYYRDPFFLEQIQVLKGPSSLVFGRGSTGGVVEQDSKSPRLSPITAGTLAFGTDNTKRLTADFGRAVEELGHGTAFRLNVLAHENNVADRDVAEFSRFGIAPSLAFGLGTPTRLTLTYLHQQEDDIPDYGLPWVYKGTPPPMGVFPTGTASPVPLSIGQENFYGFKSDFLKTQVDIPTVKFEHDFNDHFTIRNQLRYAMYERDFRITEPRITTSAGSTNLRLIPPGTPLGNIPVSRNLIEGFSDETFLRDQLDLTARFKTGFIDHTVVTGAEAGHESSTPFRTTIVTPYSQTPLGDPNDDQNFNATSRANTHNRTNAESQAVFLLDTLKFGEKWQLMGGLRYDRFDARSRNRTYDNPATMANENARIDFNRFDDFVSWRTGLVFKPLPNGSIYFGAGTSFNPSAENLSLAVNSANVAPEENETYEIGTKWDLFHDRLSFTAALYQTEKLNVRETVAGTTDQLLIGSAIVKGFEIAAAGKITDDWQVNVGYAYTFSEITKAAPTLAGTNSSQGLNLGQRLANVPEHTLSFWTTYQTPWKFEIGGGVDYVSDRLASSLPQTVGNINFYREVGDYWTLSSLIKYPLTRHINLQMNMYNLTNNEYYDQIHPSHVVPGAGRSALFTIGFNY